MPNQVSIVSLIQSSRRALDPCAFNYEISSLPDYRRSILTVFNGEGPVGAFVLTRTK